MMANERKWLAGRLKWSEQLRQRQWDILGEHAAQSVIGAFAVAICCWMVSHWQRKVWLVALAVLVGLLILLLYRVVSHLPVLTQDGCRRKLRRALAGLDPASREQFARDQLEAEQDPDRRMDLLMTGYRQDQIPAQVVVGKRYLCMVGGSAFGPVIIDLSRVNRIRPAVRQKRVSPLVRKWHTSWGESTADQQFLLFFENQPDPDLPDRATLEGTLVFGCLENRRQVLALLRYYFNGEIWLNETQRGPNLRILR